MVGIFWRLANIGKAINEFLDVFGQIGKAKGHKPFSTAPFLKKVLDCVLI